MSLEQIQKQAHTHSEARSALIDAVSEVEEKTRLIQRKHLPKIRRLFRRFADTRSDLVNSVETHPELFKRPKSQSYFGIKLGFRKKKGKITFKNEALVIERIRRHCPEHEELLIETKETVSKTGLEKLPADMLKKLGASVVSDCDEPFVKATDSAIDKIIAGLEKDDEFKATAEAE